MKYLDKEIRKNKILKKLQALYNLQSKTTT